MVEKAPTPERIDKEREIIELRTEGYVWREIAVHGGHEYGWRRTRLTTGL
jgi:hypothetical protein